MNPSSPPFVSPFCCNLNFASSVTNTHEDDNCSGGDVNTQRKKSSSRDPLSHRIIEKRRRDRMNNCLADLSRLIPTSYLKKSASLQGRGRIEKTEIIEMAIKHLKHLQAHKYCNDDTNCELSNTSHLQTEEYARQFKLGYQECVSEAMRFLVEVEGLFSGEGLCRRMMDYLENHIITLDKVIHCIDSDSENSVNKSTKSLQEKEKMDVSESEPISHSIPVMTSHLREMLESSPKNKCASQTDSMPVSPSESSASHQNEVYNFKKDIKDRFQADQKLTPEPTKVSSPLNTIDDERVSNSSLSSLATQLSDQRSETSGYSSKSSSMSHKPVLSSLVVPVFALHPSGSYYIPLTIDASIIGPYIHANGTDINPFPVLHPINIAVNFNYQMQKLNHEMPHMWSSMMPILRPNITSNLTLSQPQSTFAFSNTETDSIAQPESKFNVSSMKVIPSDCNINLN